MVNFLTDNSAKLYYIYNSAFLNCSSLVLSRNFSMCSVVDENAFKGCSNLGAMVLGGSSAGCTIYVSAFENCIAMPTISVKYNASGQLHSNAFKGCSNLTSMTLTGVNPLIYFNNGCFSGCSKLVNVDFGTTNAINLSSAS